MRSSLQLLLVQARATADPMAGHELECFVDGCELSRDQFTVFNLAEDDVDNFSLEGVDGVVIGGSGDFSLAEGGFDWHTDALEVARYLVRSGIPTFGACFGLQVVVQALGGTVVRDEARAEVGTFPVTLTEAARLDPVFGGLPSSFDVQLGHKDSAAELPDELIQFATGGRCEYQAVKVRHRPFVATQFHPELTRQGSLERFRNYLQSYSRPDDDFEEAMAHARKMHQPSPHASALLPAFVRDVVRRKKKSA